LYDLDDIAVTDRGGLDFPRQQGHLVVLHDDGFSRQTHGFEPAEFNAVISRHGVMFFDDPTAAFANLRRTAKPGGQLAFVCWRSPRDNPFMAVAATAVVPLLPAFQAPAPDAPGQFALADARKVRGILAAAGWKHVDVTPLDAPTVVAEADLMTYVTRMGPVGVALREVDAATHATAVEALRRGFEPFVAAGEARFELACWVVTARA